MEMIEHPDISAMMRYGTLEKNERRLKPGFLYGYVYAKSREDEGECDSEDDNKGVRDRQE